jgi:ABC-type uncharacterized transport system permease subunit
MVALGRMTPLYFAWGLIAPIVFGAIAARCWSQSIKHYASGGN